MIVHRVVRLTKISACLLTTMAGKTRHLTQRSLRAREVGIIVMRASGNKTKPKAHDPGIKMKTGRKDPGNTAKIKMSFSQLSIQETRHLMQRSWQPSVQQASSPTEDLRGPDLPRSPWSAAPFAQVCRWQSTHVCRHWARDVKGAHETLKTQKVINKPRML